MRNIFYTITYDANTQRFIPVVDGKPNPKRSCISGHRAIHEARRQAEAIVKRYKDNNEPARALTKGATIL